MGACVKREKNAYFKELLREELRAELLKKYVGKRTNNPDMKQEPKPAIAVPVKSSKKPTKTTKKAAEQTPPPVELPTSETPGKGLGTMDDSRKEEKEADKPSSSPAILEQDFSEDSLIPNRPSPAQQESSALPESEVFSPFESLQSEQGIQAITEENVVTSEETTPRANAEQEMVVSNEPAEREEVAEIERPSTNPDAAFVFLRSHYLRNPAPLLTEEEMEMNFQGRLTIEVEQEHRKSWIEGDVIS